MTHCTVRNLNVIGSGSTLTLFGIGFGGSTISLFSTGTGNSFNQVTNCAVRQVQNGVYSAGASATPV